MAKANNSTTKQTDDSALEKRVDAMMDPHTAESIDAPLTPAAPVLPPLDIYAEPTSAPLLTKKPSKRVTPIEQPVEVVPTEEPQVPAEEQLPPSDDVQVKPLNIDTPQSDAAIDDIVAQEADAVLAAEDAQLVTETTDEMPVPNESTRRGHPIFWFVVFMLAVLCVVAAIMLINPNVSLPFSS